MDKSEFYKTGQAIGSNIFDTTKTDGLDDLLPGSGEAERAERVKNLKGEIVMMSPYEYF